MDTIFLKGAAALVVATLSACAWAGGDARVRPEPPIVRSVDSPGTPAAAAVTETWITTPSGTLRERTGASDAPDRTDSGAPQAVNVTGPNGQRIRVVPGVQPDPSAAPAAPALPAGAVVVEVDGAKMLRIPGVADGLQAAAVAAPPPAGMRIVDLPPGAVAPVGMPEPMTLYRVVSGPASPTALPAAPE